MPPVRKQEEESKITQQVNENENRNQNLDQPRLTQIYPESISPEQPMLVL